jgi:hypothetical protein
MRTQSSAVAFAVTAIIAATCLSPTGTSAQEGDRFSYDPQRQAQENARQQVRSTTADSVYVCVKAMVWGDIHGGARSRSVIRHDPRLVGCFGLLKSSNWFAEGEKRPLFDRMVDRAINEVIAGGDS